MKEPGYEGDDILGTLARACTNRGIRLLIVTGDKDLFQLVKDPLVQVLYTRRGVATEQVLDEAGVVDVVGVPPSRYTEFVSVRGDKSDNLPGVPGVGTKGAVAITAAAPSLDALLADASVLPPRLERALVAARDTVLRNMKLVRILDDVPIDWEALGLLDARPSVGPTDDLTREGLSEYYYTLTDALRMKHADVSGNDAATKVQPAISRRGDRTAIVGCSAEKLSHPAAARELYSSRRFELARRWAEENTKRWFVLSAKHGLVDPEGTLGPYDLALDDLSSEQRSAWADAAMSKLIHSTPSNDVFYFLCDDSYADPVANLVEKAGYRTVKPLHGMTRELHRKWLSAHVQIGPTSAELEDFYWILSWLSARTGGPLPLANAHSTPLQGVYFFFEPQEFRLFSHQSRVVRVGTHAVSANSKSTLRQRLRAHVGSADGSGNHRSSVFRSHVGAALMTQQRIAKTLRHWGDQSADTPSNRAAETILEKLVSETISRMPVLCLDVGGAPGPRSDRAFVERNSIAILSSAGARVDVPSSEWLGHSSIHPAIRRSGLWNVNFADETTWDPDFLDVLEFYAKVTAGLLPQPAAAVAPAGWWDRSASHGQLGFSWKSDAS